MNTPPKDSTIINVCIIPTDDVGTKCVEISQSLKSDDTMFVLDGISKFAHMTIFMARFADSEIINVLNSTETILKKLYREKLSRWQSHRESSYKFNNN